MLRIGLLAAPFLRVPPPGYGGTERVVAALANALVDHGHDVTLFASADSRTKARLVPTIDRPMWSDDRLRDSEAARTRAIGIGFRSAAELELEILNTHTGFHALPAARLSPVPVLHTTHWRLDEPDERLVYREFRDVPMVSISDAQRAPLPDQHWIATIHHGLPSDAFRPGRGRGGYLAYCGRFAREKGVDRAIGIARRLGRRLKIAARRPTAATPDSLDYFEDVIRPQLADPLIEYIGEADDAVKQQLLGDAEAFLFPIEWPEPFGIAQIEALACGTPIVARRVGAIPEIVRDGVNGYTGTTDEELAASVERAAKLDRRRVRATFDESFTAEVMARRYESAYERVLDDARHEERLVTHP